MTTGNCLYLFPANAGFFPIVLSLDIMSTKNRTAEFIVVSASVAAGAALIAAAIASAPVSAPIAAVGGSMLGVGAMLPFTTSSGNGFEEKALSSAPYQRKEVEAQLKSIIHTILNHKYFSVSEAIALDKSAKLQYDTVFSNRYLKDMIVDIDKVVELTQELIEDSSKTPVKVA